jgi:catechol 2,3-dioxygenase-like lactoylglutathione lyase family enzyme
MNVEDSGLHHVTLRVRDLGTSRDFYEQVLGLKVEVFPDRLRLRLGGTRLLLREPLEGTASSDRFSEYRVGLDHIAFSVSEREELGRLIERLRASGVKTRGIQSWEEGGSRAEFVCLRDPDNIQLEFWWPDPGC